MIQAVMQGNSVLIDQSAAQAPLFDQHGVDLIAISPSGQRMTERLAQRVLAAGDVMLLQGPLDQLAERIQALGHLPLAERELRLGSMRRAILPVVILAVAMGATAFGLVQGAAGMAIRRDWALRSRSWCLWSGFRSY